MTGELLSIITATDADLRNRPLEAYCESASAESLLSACAELDDFRRRCDNLYERVRALFFLYAIHRFHLPKKLPAGARPGKIPFDAHLHLLHRRFREAIDDLLRVQRETGPSDALCSALATAYHSLGFQTLADQVRRSVRSVLGNQWIFRIGHPADHPLRLRSGMLQRDDAGGAFPILSEETPVRMDLSHSGWSDIFFLGMDYPQGARVLNVSIDLAVRGRDPVPRPPVETYLRVIDEPVLRLVSVDLGARADVTSLPEIFDFGRDYLGLLKAAVIASGLVPPGLEGSEQELRHVLERLTGHAALGVEVVSKVNNIPKGSRLAVSTTLLASLISLCMRATGQTDSLTGSLEEGERRTVAARAILGEWLAGSGGGWQDSGGIWPGMKLIRGALAQEGDPEWGVSRGRLLPDHHLLTEQEASAGTRQALQDSLVLVHGGMAQDVGPILEMVTEKYLLRSNVEWQARQEAIRVFDSILDALKRGDVREIGRLTTHNFEAPLQTIIPWADNCYTDTLIERTRTRFGDSFWGFWMLGGASGGGMGFIFDPSEKAAAQEFLQETMLQTKSAFEHTLPFAMDPVVYDFAINEAGTQAEILREQSAHLPPLVEVQAISDLAAPESESVDSGQLQAILTELGFDRQQHEQIRADLRASRIGLAQNQLPVATTIEDVQPGDITDVRSDPDSESEQLGCELLQSGAVGVVTLAAGVGSRWTQGAGVVKALHPFCKFARTYRSFLEVHLAKTRQAARQFGIALPHVITTSHLTHDPIQNALETSSIARNVNPVLLSPGRSIGLRLIPMVRDLQFAWEQGGEQLLDAQAQKMRDSSRAALIEWARNTSEGADYTDNLPQQCLHPVGHWYEVPNMLRNGVLARLLREHPQLRYLMLHNVDTLGADLRPDLLGLHAASAHCLSFEVIPRRLQDRGGGLARVDGRLRLLEGLAMPREEDEFNLSYYNSATTWIDIDRLLDAFNLTRLDLSDTDRVAAAIRGLAGRIPTYVALKDVKKRWGRGQEDIHPVAQFEKLWTDMSAVPDIDCGFFVVSRNRGQQLKEPAQLDGFVRDGSARLVDSLCDWD